MSSVETIVYYSTQEQDTWLAVAELLNKQSASLGIAPDLLLLVLLERFSSHPASYRHEVIAARFQDQAEKLSLVEEEEEETLASCNPSEITNGIPVKG